jgi:hypothetical protein
MSQQSVKAPIWVWIWIATLALASLSQEGKTDLLEKRVEKIEQAGRK